MRLTAFTLMAALIGVNRLDATAQPTSTGSISLQARLDGVGDGNVTLHVRFYNALVGGTQVGATITVTTTVVDGIVSVPVSPVDPAIFNGSTRYMGISVSGDTELTPRTLVTSVPFATASGNLYPTVGSDPRVLGTLRASNGFWAESADLYSFAYVGNFHQGFYPDWNGTGREADFYRLIGTVDSSGGYGIAFGVDIVSPVVWMNNQPGNAFKVVGVDAVSPLPRDGIELLSVSTTGTTTVKVLQITGGADLAEPIAITPLDGTCHAEPGMVMVIDRANDGKLVPCTAAYDRAVAGVLSGANGLAPGMILHAEGHALADGRGNSMPLAMAGRVWVWCDAGNGPVRRGDSLTTSTTPGHAMVVGDDSRRAGTVIGKAMTELTEGKGLVLVLVNLQ